LRSSVERKGLLVVERRKADRMNSLAFIMHKGGRRARPEEKRVWGRRSIPKGAGVYVSGSINLVYFMDFRGQSAWRAEGRKVGGRERWNRLPLPPLRKGKPSIKKKA